MYKFSPKSYSSAIFILMVIVIIIPLLIITGFSIHIINNNIEKNLESSVLESAESFKAIYSNRLENLFRSSLLLSKNELFINSIEENSSSAKNLLQEYSVIEELDAAIVVSNNGAIIMGLNNVSGISSLNKLIIYSVTKNISIASTEIIAGEDLGKISKKLALQSSIKKIPTLFQEENLSKLETNGLAIVAISPIKKNNKVVGAIVLIDVLNRDYKIPDSIKRKTNWEASIFQKDVIVSTTMKTANDYRYVGISASSIIVKTTLIKGKEFLGRVWTANRWSRASYIPIKNYQGENIGMLEISIPEEKFMHTELFYENFDVKKIIVYVAIIIVLLSAIIAYFMSKSLVKPIVLLKDSINKLGEGNFDQGVNINSYKEINDLAKNLNIMIRTLRKKIVEKELEIIQMVKKKK